MAYVESDYVLDNEYLSHHFYELYQFGKDGDYFELVESPIKDYIGTRVVLKESKYGIVIKRAGAYDNDSSDNLITPYGALTGGVWKKLKRVPKQRVSLPVALNYIVLGIPVYIKDSGTEYVKVSNEYCILETVGIHDFQDLKKAEFYA